MSKPIKGSATCADTICLSVLNPGSKPDANQPVFYLGEASALNVRLVNATGSDITLKSGAALDIFFQSLSVAPAACKINLPGWTLTPKQYSLNLAYTAGSSATWGQGDPNAIAFQITGVQSSLTQATAGFFQINFSGLTGNNVPGRLKMPLSLIAAPQPGKAVLDILVELSDGGIIYVPQPGGDPVKNRLLLNVVNEGKQALFSGTPGQQGTPEIAVSFVYGSTAGALAPDADKSAPQTGSAWNIKAKESISEGNGWFPTDPDPSGKPTDPVWLLQPDQNNHPLIGTGAAAAVQFEFDEVISQLPGVTLMSVQFSGFKKNDTQRYNDKLFVLPISKEYLPSPGLIRFSSEVTKIEVNSSSQEVSIPLFWSMTGVSKIVLEFSSTVTPNIPDVTIPYGGTQPALQFDRYTLQFQGVACSGSLSVTCRAYDANGNDLNDLQQTITIDFPPVVTAYTGDIQADGSLLLKWTTQGATGVTFAFSASPFNQNGKTTIPNPPMPLLNNDYYALTAKGGRQNENSAPYVFKVCKKLGAVEDIIGVGGDPQGIAVAPNGEYVFVCNYNDNSVSVIDLKNGPPFKALQPTIAVGGNPTAVAVSPKGDYAFVANSLGNDVAVIDLRTGPPFSVLSLVNGIGSISDAIAVSPKGEFVFVGNFGDNTVSVIDIRTGPPFSVLPAIWVGVEPDDVAFSPKGDYAFVANNNDNTVAVLDIKSGPPFKVLSPAIQFGESAENLAVSPNGDFVFVSVYYNSVYVIDLRSGPPFKVLSPPISAGNGAAGIAAAPDGNSVWVCGMDGEVLSVIDLGSGPPFAIQRTISVGGAPRNIAFSPNGNYVFMVANSGNSVYVIGPESVSAF